MNKVTVIIVDDHEIVREGIKLLLSTNKTVKVIGEASNDKEFFDLLKVENPDVVILDIEMPGMDGLQISEILEDDYPQIKKILLSANIDETTIPIAIDKGVLGILPKNCSHNDLNSAIEKANKGEPYYNRYVTDLLIKSYVDKSNIGNKFEKKSKVELSEREVEVIKCFSDGMIYKEIADQLNISPRTVESHKNNILKKLELNTVIDLVKYAIKNEIVSL